MENCVKTCTREDLANYGLRAKLNNTGKNHFRTSKTTLAFRYGPQRNYYILLIHCDMIETSLSSSKYLD